jgi:hypothetical protein
MHEFARCSRYPKMIHFAMEFRKPPISSITIKMKPNNRIYVKIGLFGYLLSVIRYSLKKDKIHFIFAFQITNNK